MAEQDLAGKKFLVTGASTGIGLETARALAQRGAHLLLASRDRTRGEAALEEVKKSTGNSRLEFFPVDLSSMADTRRFAKDLIAKHPVIDVVIHNAALAPMERSLTSEGYEPAIATNVLAPYVLTHLLRPALEKAPGPRAVFINGAMGPIDLGDLHYQQGKFQPFMAYKRSKLAEHWLYSEFARRWKDSKIVFLSVNPGMVPSTPGFQAVPFWMRLMVKTVMRGMTGTPAEGARGPVWVATDPEMKNNSGKLFQWKKEYTDTSYGFPEGWNDPAKAQKMWDVAAQLTGIS